MQYCVIWSCSVIWKQNCLPVDRDWRCRLCTSAVAVELRRAEVFIGLVAGGSRSLSWWVCHGLPTFDKLQTAYLPPSLDIVILAHHSARCSCIPSLSCEDESWVSTTFAKTTAASATNNCYGNCRTVAAGSDCQHCTSTTTTTVAACTILPRRKLTLPPPQNTRNHTQRFPAVPRLR